MKYFTQIIFVFIVILHFQGFSQEKEFNGVPDITFETARKLARIEGVFGGVTSGSNVWAALQRAKLIGKGKTIVTVICDSGLKYLNGDLYK